MGCPLPLTLEPERVMASTKSPDIPVVDFAGWNTESSRRQIAQNIVAACKKVGFVYIVNHSLPDRC